MKREKEKKLNQAFYQGSWKRDSAEPKAGIDGERPAAWRRGSDKRRGVGGGPRKDRGAKKERRMNATMRDQGGKERQGRRKGTGERDLIFSTNFDMLNTFMTFR